MKIRTLRFIVKEGLSNAFKNRLMTLASVSIVVTSLIIFGTFLLFVVNLNHNIAILKQQPELKVFCEYELDDSQVQQVEDAIKQNGDIEGYEVISRKQAFEGLKEQLGESAGVLDGYDETILSVSFNIAVKELKNAPKVVEELKNTYGVKKVAYSQEVTDLIAKFSNWVNILSILFAFLLIAFSVSIIANTIKLTVFARRKEISIMKFIGAADWFIRWPFIIEGIAIGMIGAVVAFILTRMGYMTVAAKFNRDLANISLNFVRIVRTEEIQYFLAASYAMIGGAVGAVGSFISIRKYLEV